MLRHKVPLLASFFSLLIALALPLTAQEQAQDQDINSHARIVRISYIEGTVQLDNSHGFENVTMNVPISQGARLLTRSDGWAEVQFEDGSSIRLAPETQIKFSQLARHSSGGTITTVDLDQGEVEFQVAAHEGSDFAVTVRNKAIVLKHSGRFRVTSTNSDPLEVAVSKGEVGVKDFSSGDEVSVRKNETFTLDSSDPDQYDLARGVNADELDRWSHGREEYLSSNAGNQNYLQSPYQYGSSDLNYYGQYVDVAGYGYCWQPYGVNLGWDPFMNGYWAFSPQFGYYWVSSYPWGWMPYRYGRWVFINGRGWFWQPGFWGGWHSQPLIAQAPPGFHPPIPPAQVISGREPIVGHNPGSTRGPVTRTFNGESPAQVERRIPDRRVFTNDDIEKLVPSSNAGSTEQQSQSGTSGTDKANIHPPVSSRPVEEPSRPVTSQPNPAPAPSAPVIHAPRETRPNAPPPSAPRMESAPMSHGGSSGSSGSSHSSSGSGRPH